jgi:hypothetical protein
MIVTIHQPEHFPYEGFFKKMKNSDLFVVLDNVKYKKNDFQNRNRFINTAGSDEWFGVSVPKKSTSLNINEVVVLDNKLNQWRKKVVNKINYNFGIDMSEIYNFSKLIDINMASIIWCRKKLEIETPMVLASELSVQGRKSNLLLDICKKTNASTYLSGPSGVNYLDTELFKKQKIKVEFFNQKVKNYYSMLYNIMRGTY